MEFYSKNVLQLVTCFSFFPSFLLFFLSTKTATNSMNSEFGSKKKIKIIRISYFESFRMKNSRCQFIAEVQLKM